MVKAIRMGSVISFELVTPGNHVVCTYNEGDEALARARAKEQGYRLVRTTRTVEEIRP